MKWKQLLTGLIAASLSSHPLVAQETKAPDYRVESTDHFRCFFKEQHFLSVLTDGGIYDLRPHPGIDPDGWGLSWYVQPFLPGATLSHTVLDSLMADDTGIHLIAHGKVSEGNLQSYGNWNSLIDAVYRADEKIVQGTCTMQITVDGLLQQKGDLNIFKVASNYLQDVPLLDGSDGDTGDTIEVDLEGDLFSSVWIPPATPSYYPQESFSSLGIMMKGDYYDLDSWAHGLDFFLIPAYKPNLSLQVLPQDGNPVWYCSSFDTRYSDDFWSDNVEVVAQVRKHWAATSYSYKILFSSSPLPFDGIDLDKDGRIERDDLFQSSTYWQSDKILPRHLLTLLEGWHEHFKEDK